MPAEALGQVEQLPQPVEGQLLQLLERGRRAPQDPDLVEALAVLDIGAMIPPELYEVIAEVLAWAYRANSSFSSTTRGLATSG